MTADATATVDIPLTSGHSCSAGPDLALLRRTIASTDLELLLVTDDLDPAAAHLDRNARQQFRLKPRPEQRPSWWLGESDA